MNDVVTDLSLDMPQLTAELKMLRPGTTQPSGWVLTMAGPEHPKALAFREVAQRRSLARELEITQAKANGQSEPVRAAADIQRDTIDFLVSRIVTWTPIKIDGLEYPFSDDVAKGLLGRPAMALYMAQIVKFIGAERSFMLGSATI